MRSLLQSALVRNAFLLLAGVGGAAALVGACGGDGGSTPGGDASTCNAPLAQCGAACTDLQSDPNNCGACGKACDTAKAEVCSQGACALACGGGTTQCGSSCFDTSVDPNNCGSCGNKCAAGESCAGGKCGVACATGLTLCGDGGGVCVDTKSDDENCGSCGNACPANQSCSAGTCTANLVTSGPTDVTGNLTSCSTGVGQVEHRAAMTDGHSLALGMVCSGTAYVVTSTNGGLSWSAPVSTAMANVQSFALAAARGSATLYAAAVDNTNTLFYSSSTDGGATWSAPVGIDTAVYGGGGLRVDSYKDTVYISERSTSNGALHIVRNGMGAGDAGLVDAGDAGFAVTSVTFTNGVAFGDVMVDASNGDVWFSSDNPSFQLIRSTDGGATFGAVQTAPGQLFFSDWVLANGTIFGAGETGAPGNGGVYALPVASIATPTFAGGVGFGVAQLYSLAADSAGNVYTVSVESAGVQIAKVPFGSGEPVDDAGVVSDAGLDSGTVTKAIVSNAPSATGPQIATRVPNAAMYGYTFNGRVFAGVKAF